MKTEDETQPTPLQIAEYAQKVASYPNWDKVLAVFREAAFSSVSA